MTDEEILKNLAEGKVDELPGVIYFDQDNAAHWVIPVKREQAIGILCARMLKTPGHVVKSAFWFPDGAEDITKAVENHLTACKESWEKNGMIMPDFSHK